MFGYVKPLKGELKMREYEHYRATYCGLCNALRRRYGLVSRFIINYDFTFLAIVLEAMEPQGCEYEKKRCIASPFKKKCAVCKSKALDFSADTSVILAYWKLCDDVSDKTGFKKIGARTLKLLLKHSYKKACKELSWFDDTVQEALSELWDIERERRVGIDAPADTFARILASMSEYFKNENMRRISKEMFYHIGRVIYLIDALYDVEEDKKSGNYNPIIETGIDKEEIEQTINCSLNTAIAAWSLVPEHAMSDLILNVLTLGVPSMLNEKEKKG